jgi:hypothetical protein
MVNHGNEANCRIRRIGGVSLQRFLLLGRRTLSFAGCVRPRSSFTIRDIAEALDSTPVPSSVERICGIGHSMGAAGLVLASLAGVRRFSHVRLPV